MGDYLLFRLYGPMASWGDIAVGEVRPSQTHPGRSAALGLVAAALGVERDREEALGAIERGYGFAVRIDRALAQLPDIARRADGIASTTLLGLLENWDTNFGVLCALAEVLSRGGLDDPRWRAEVTPLAALKLAGVDMTTPDAVEKTYAVLAGYVDRLEKLTGA